MRDVVSRGPFQMPASTPSKKILIVDDEQAIVDLISDVLEKYSYEPIVATLWTEAIDAIGNRNPDLLLLDLKMPTIDGPSMLEFIRKEGIDLPVIIVSGFLTDEVAEELSRFGVSGFVHKPFKVSRLKAEIERVIGAAKQPPPSPAPLEAEQAEPAAAETATVESLYNRPPEPVPEPGPDGAQPAPPRPDEADILKALEKRHAAPADAPDRRSAPAEDPVPEDQILKAFEGLKSRQAEPPAETQIEPSAPVPSTDRQGRAPRPAQELKVEKRDVQPEQQPAAVSSTAPEPGASSPSLAPDAQPAAPRSEPHSRRHSRRRPRSSSRRRRNLLLYGSIFLACVVVSGFLALMQWWEAQGGLEKVKAKATQSMSEQVKEEILKEIQQQQRP